MRELDTPHGPARVHLHEVEEPLAALVLGHGAGGGVESPDLKGAAAAAREAGLTVALVEQPYRVAGRRSPAPANQLDAAWTSMIEELALDVPLIAGGRSSGARVACRTAAETGAIGVLCLAFPLVPPQRRNATSPPPSRQDELDLPTVPVLVVQGENDRFGMPDPDGDRTVVRVRGDHRLASDRAALRTAVEQWLGALVPGS